MEEDNSSQRNLVNLSISQSVGQSVSVDLSVYLSVHPPIYLSSCILTYLDHFNNLIRCFGMQYGSVFLQVVLYFDSQGSSKYKQVVKILMDTTHQNI